MSLSRRSLSMPPAIQRARTAPRKLTSTIRALEPWKYPKSLHQGKNEKNGIAEAIPFLSCPTMFSYREAPFAAPSSFSLPRNRPFACCAGDSACAPHFFFLERKKKRAAPGAKKKEHSAALRCLGLLRIDRFLSTVRSAIWKCFRMRFPYSAAAAQCVQSCLSHLGAER